MKRYIARFARGGFPELYVVLDTQEGCVLGEPKPDHLANDEAGERNNGTWGQAQNPVGEQVAALHASLWAWTLPPTLKP